MICLKEGEIDFHFRVAGILIRNGKILIQRAIKDKAYSLPGGRVEIFEQTENTLLREWKEEMSADIRIERLLWIQEQFAKWEDGKKHHCLCFYYLVSLKEPSNIPLEGNFYSEQDNDSEIEFSWVEIDKIKEMKFYPVFARTRLNNLPIHIERIVEYE